MNQKKNPLAQGLKAVANRQAKVRAMNLTVQTFSEECAAARTVAITSSTIYLPLNVGSRFTVATADPQGIPGTTGHHCLTSDDLGFQADYPNGIEIGVGAPSVSGSGQMEYSVEVRALDCPCDGSAIYQPV